MFEDIMLLNFKKIRINIKDNSCTTLNLLEQYDKNFFVKNTILLSIN